MDVAKTLLLLVMINLLIMCSISTPLSGFLGKQCLIMAPNKPDFDILMYERNVQDAVPILFQGDFNNYNASRGNYPDTAHVTATCRGDISNQQCGKCLQSLYIEQLLTSDPNISCTSQGKTEGIIYYAECMLRYANRPILSVYEVSPVYNQLDSAKSDSFYLNLDPIPYMILKNLLSALTLEAGDSQQKFAAGMATFNSSSNVYATVQCTPNLFPKECIACLNEALKYTAHSFVGTQGFVLLPSCWLLYDRKCFYNASAEAHPQPAETSSSYMGVRTAVMGAIALATVAAFLTFICTCVCLRYQRPARGKQLEVCSILSSEDEDDYQAFQFPYDTIKSATEDFHQQLGKGGFGPVYKGKLHGQEIAVKKLSQKSSQGDREFGNEVRLLSKIQHRNLVKLLGFSFQNKDRLLIYEYLPNRSLDLYLFDPIKRAALNWGIRYKIIRGIARGIMYLHEDSRLKIIHCDLKTSNILLDEKMNAKISDFGLAKLFALDQSYKQTDRFAGTYGYAAPEYAIEGFVSTKTDAYSFGIMVLEIITGQRNSKFKTEEGSDSFISYVWSNWKSNRPLDIVDPLLLTCSLTQYEIIRCIHIGLLCIQKNGKERPTMTQVVSMLTNCVTELRGPSQPAFIATNSFSAPVTQQFIHILNLAEFKKLGENQNEHSIVMKNY